MLSRKVHHPPYLQDVMNIYYSTFWEKIPLKSWLRTIFPAYQIRTNNSESREKSMETKELKEMKNESDWIPHLIPAAIASVMLFIAIGRWPYGYYRLMRFAVCAAGVCVAVMAYNWQKIWATWLFGIIAVLFNPLIRIHLTREIWQPIDLICALLFVYVAFVLREPTKSQPTDSP